MSALEEPVRRAVVYLRVSTDQQLEGYGLEVQRAKCLELAASLGLEVVDVHADEGQSGSAPLEDRLGLADAVDDLKCGRAEELIVYDLSRLSRELIAQEIVIDQLAKAGARIHSCDGTEERYLEGDPNAEDAHSRKFVRQVFGAARSYEAALIRQRLARGRRAKRAAGGYIGGFVGYGVLVADDRLVVDPAELEVLELIASLRASGPTWTWRRVAAELADRGYAAPRGGTWEANSARRAYLRYCELSGTTPEGRAHKTGPRARASGPT